MKPRLKTGKDQEKKLFSSKDSFLLSFQSFPSSSRGEGDVDSSVEWATGDRALVPSFIFAAYVTIEWLITAMLTFAGVKSISLTSRSFETQNNWTRLYERPASGWFACSSFHQETSTIWFALAQPTVCSWAAALLHIPALFSVTCPYALCFDGNSLVRLISIASCFDDKILTSALNIQPSR